MSALLSRRTQMLSRRLTKWRFILTLMMFISVLARPLFAYDVTLKDGRVIHFKKYHVADNKLYFTDDEGREGSVVLDSVNIDLTRQLNKNENPPLELPGLSNDHEKEATSQRPSLAEVARQIRADKLTTTQHIFTNDDVQSATGEDRIQDWIRAGASPSSADPAKWGKFREAAIALAKVSQRLTEQEVALQALGKLYEIQFPGRDRWQVQLYAAHQRVYTLFETCFERTDEENKVACSKIESAQYDLKLLEQEGNKRAISWKEDREK
jgi:hypothetical protein